jgi:hypothetical protein
MSSPIEVGAGMWEVQYDGSIYDFTVVAVTAKLIMLASTHHVSRTRLYRDAQRDGRVMHSCGTWYYANRAEAEAAAAPLAAAWPWVAA